MAYYALKAAGVPSELTNEILSFLGPTPEQLKQQRLMRELNVHFINYDITNTIPFLRKFGVSFSCRKWQLYASLYHDLGFEFPMEEDFTDFE